MGWTHGDTMKDKLLPVTAVVVVIMAITAYTLLDRQPDSLLAGFKLEDGVINPYAMTCREFSKADDNLKLFVSAWYDGDSTTTNLAEVEYAREDVLDMRQHLIDGCVDEPESTLENLVFQYGVDDANYQPARCSLLNGMADSAEAVMYLGWAVGYLAQQRDEFNVDISGFYPLGDTMLNICKTAPQANMVELVLDYLD